MKLCTFAHGDDAVTHQPTVYARLEVSVYEGDHRAARAALVREVREWLREEEELYPEVREAGTSVPPARRVKRGDSGT